ncbi:MAG: hypothetical protein H5U40_08020, partial [Polyangiaceae bacterium]|nr:hypothetical protein [Polyangiaceae bacterium]
SIAYLNAEPLELSATEVGFYDSAYAPQLSSIAANDRPSVGVGAAGESLYGGYLRFVRAEGDFLPLINGNANPGEGFLVSAALRFRDLTIEDGGTRTVVAKSNSGGFTLELHNPTGEAAAVLRFGVYVGSGYVYATYPVASLVTGRSYGLTGAYDGNGGVYVWLDNSNTGVTNGNASGGVGGTSVPITIGADPQTSTSARFFADVDVQVVNVQRWGAH